MLDHAGMAENRPLQVKVEGTYSVQTTLALVIMVVVTGLVLQGRGAIPPQFAPLTNFPAGRFPSALAVGDFNADGRTDVVVVQSGGISTLLGLGDGRLDAAITCSVPGSLSGTAIATGDFNHDRHRDLVVAGYYNTRILIGDGTGHFSISTNLDSYAAYPAAIAVGDFDGDGNTDLAAVKNNASVGVYLGRGDGSFAPRTDYMIGNSVCDIRAGDLDGNGRLDLVAALSFYASSNTLCVLMNKGDGSFAAPQYYAGGSRYEFHDCLELADFDGDGRLDIVTGNREAQSVTMWRNSATGKLVAAHDYPLGFTPTRIAKGDFNGDRKTDFIVHGSTATSLLLGNSDGSFKVGPQMVTGAAPDANNPLAVGDFDGNGTPDIAFANGSDNSVAVMLNRTPPTLEFVPSAGYNQVSWLSTFGTGFTLEYTTNPTVPGGWQPFPYPPVLIGNQKAVADWADWERKFYRLRKQQR